MNKCLVAVAVLAILLAVVGNLTHPKPIGGFAPDDPEHVGSDYGRRWVLGDTTYPTQKVKAPAATSWFLRTFQWVATRSPFGPLLRRGLLNKNDVHRLRELAAQVDMTKTRILYQPIRRLGKAAYEKHVQAAQEASVQAALSGPDSLPRSQPVQKDGSVLFREIADYAEMYRSGKTTPSEAIEEVLQAIDDLAELRGFQEVHREEVQAQAAASTARFAAGKPLSVFDGVPIAVKDMIYVKGHTKTSGTRTKAPPAEHDDVMVARFRAAGAIIVGTTMKTEFGVTPLGFNSHFNGSYNPYDTRYYPGGSSSGSAVVVAAGIVPMAIGWDGGGSIRIPSAISGVYGLSTTFARTPWNGIGPTTSNMIHAGPMTATARDLALGYAVMAPNEPGHAFTEAYGEMVGGPPPPHLQGFTADPASTFKGLRIGVFRPHYEDSPAVSVAACDAALAYMVSQGAEIVDIAIPNIKTLGLAHGFGISMEFSHFQDWRFWHDNDEGHPFALEPNTRIQLGLGQTMSGVELLSANRLKGYAYDYMNDLFTKVDVIATPTVGTATPPLTASARDCGESNTSQLVEMMKYIFLGNLLGNPGISVPVGYGPGQDVLRESPETTQGKLPIGMHFMADHWQDTLLLNVAAALEAGHAGNLRRRPDNFVSFQDSDAAADAVEEQEVQASM